MKFNEYIQMLVESKESDFSADSFALVLKDSTDKKHKIFIDLSERMSQDEIAEKIDSVIKTVRKEILKEKLTNLLLKAFKNSKVPKEEPDFNFYVPKTVSFKVIDED